MHMKNLMIQKMIKVTTCAVKKALSWTRVGNFNLVFFPGLRTSLSAGKRERSEHKNYREVIADSVSRNRNNWSGKMWKHW